MTEYFFVATSLPSLRIGSAPEISFYDFNTLLYDNLLPGDYRQTKIFRCYYDILNIRSLWKGESVEPYGNLNQNELEEALLQREGFPSYVFDFLEQFRDEQERLQHFPELIAIYFRKELKDANPFLKEYLDFERQLRLVFVGFRAKKLGRNPAKELQYEDPDEDIIAQILAQKDAPKYEPPEGFEELKALFEEHSEDPLALNQALCEYRFSKIEEMKGTGVFSFRGILGYMVQLILAEKWMDLDQKKGTEIVNKILENITKFEGSHE